MKKTLSLITIALALAAAPVAAKVSVNLGVITVAPDESSGTLNVVEQVAGLTPNSAHVGVNSDTQVGLTIDYRFTPNWAVQLIAATPFTHDISVKGSEVDGLSIGKTKHLPPTLVAQYHFMPDSTFSPFVGVGLNYTNFFQESVSDDLVNTLVALNVATASDRVELKLKDSVGFALQAGVNYKINETLGMHFMVSKMDIGTTGRVQLNGSTIQEVKVDIDPYVAMIGLRWTL